MTSFGYNVLGFGGINYPQFTVKRWIGLNDPPSEYAPPDGVKRLWIMYVNGLETTYDLPYQSGISFAGRNYREDLLEVPDEFPNTTITIPNSVVLSPPATNGNGGARTNSSYASLNQGLTGNYAIDSISPGSGSDRRFAQKTARSVTTNPTIQVSFAARGGSGSGTDPDDYGTDTKKNGGGSGGGRCGDGAAGSPFSESSNGAGGVAPSGNEVSGVISSQQHLGIDFVYGSIAPPNQWIGYNGTPYLSANDAQINSSYAALNTALNEIGGYTNANITSSPPYAFTLGGNWGQHGGIPDARKLRSTGSVLIIELYR